MLYLYLDESGDLGFDFKSKRPSRFFTIVILAVHGADNDKLLRARVKKTLRGRRRSRGRCELKGTRESLAVKRHFYQQVEPIPFELHLVTLDKRRLRVDLRQEPGRLYDILAGKAIEGIALETAANRVRLVVDRSKSKEGIREFNSHVASCVEGRVGANVAFEIRHRGSHEDLSLQAVDLFAWGVFRSYEHDDSTWREDFGKKLRRDELWMP